MSLKNENLVKYVNCFSKIKIFVIGDIIVDNYIFGKVKRISPEAPVPVVEVTKENITLGGAANVLKNIVSLGGYATLCGVIGDDLYGEIVKKLLCDLASPTEGVFTDKTRPTTIKTRIIAHNQQVVRVDKEEIKKVSKELENQFIYFFEKNLSNYDIIIVSDYNKGVITKSLMESLTSIANNKLKKIIVDPKVPNFLLYQGVEIITPNKDEAEKISGISLETDLDILEAATYIKNKIKCNSVLITRGEEGMSLIENDNKVTHIPTVAKEVYDVTGAGDTAIATLSLALASGASKIESAKLANFSAGIVVGKIGTATVTPDELIQSIIKNGER